MVTKQKKRIPDPLLDEGVKWPNARAIAAIAECDPRTVVNELEEPGSTKGHIGKAVREAIAKFRKQRADNTNGEEKAG